MVLLDFLSKFLFTLSSAFLVLLFIFSTTSSNSFISKSWYSLFSVNAASWSANVKTAIRLEILLILILFAWLAKISKGYLPGIRRWVFAINASSLAVAFLLVILGSLSSWSDSCSGGFAPVNFIIVSSPKSCVFFPF